MFWQTNFSSPLPQILNLEGRFLILEQGSGAVAVASGFSWEYPKDGNDLGFTEKYVLLDAETFNFLKTVIIVEPPITLFDDFIFSAESVLKLDLNVDGVIQPDIVDHGLHYRFEGTSLQQANAIRIAYSESPSDLSLALHLLENGIPGRGAAPYFNSDYFPEGEIVPIHRAGFTNNSYWDGIKHELYLEIVLTDFFTTDELKGDVLVAISAGNQEISDSFLFATGLYGSQVDDDIEGTASAESILGLGGSDSLDGNAGDDTLVGGKGKDELTGGDGADRFLFADRISHNNIVAALEYKPDKIVDFLVGNDQVALDRSVFKGLREGKLKKAQFDAVTDIYDAEDKAVIAYNTKSGVLAYVKGDNEVVFAKLLGSPDEITYKEFVVVA